MYYVHIDDYVNDSWGESFCEVLNQKGENFKKINLINFESFNEVSEGSHLLARLGHLKKEKRVIKSKLSKIYDTWENIFPQQKAYSLYDDKWAEYKFLKENNISCLKTGVVNSQEEVASFLVKNEIDFPVVAKKNEGAGANKVWLKSSISDFPSNNFPLLIQPYVNVDFDLRLFYLNKKVFCLKRNHQDGSEFPYGSKWYNGDGERVDMLDYLTPEYISNLVNKFRNKIDSPTMSFDIIFDKGKPKLLEFSYCFGKNLVFECDRYYELPDFDETIYYDNKEYNNFRYLKNAVGFEVINWIGSNS